MRVVCGWCVPTKVLRDDGVNDGKISHGMCEECAAKVNKELDERAAKIKESTKREEEV
jgi:hypothetical protein